MRNHERDREMGRLQLLSPGATLSFDPLVLGLRIAGAVLAHGARCGAGGRGKVGLNL